LLIRSKRHLERVLEEFVEHYNAARPHRAIDLEVPSPMSRGGDSTTRRGSSESTDSADFSTSTPSPLDQRVCGRDRIRITGELAVSAQCHHRAHHTIADHAPATRDRRCSSRCASASTVNNASLRLASG
jgi:hypothetical protein